MAGAATRATQGISARAQLRLSASELQALDRLAARAAEVRTESDHGLGPRTRADPVRLLRGGDGDREDADPGSVRGGVSGADCRAEGPLTM